MEFKIVETIGSFHGCTRNIAIWRGTMCLHVNYQSAFKGLSLEQIIDKLRPYGITKDEAEQVYNKINGGK